MVSAQARACMTQLCRPARKCLQPALWSLNTKHMHVGQGPPPPGPMQQLCALTKQGCTALLNLKNPGQAQLMSKGTRPLLWADLQ
jgi:hypothetical protein